MGIKDTLQRIKEQLVQPAPALAEDKSLDMIQRNAPEGVSFVEVKNGRKVLCILVGDGDQKDGFVDILKKDANERSVNMLAQQIYQAMLRSPDNPLSKEVLLLRKQLRENWLDSETTLKELNISTRRD